MSLVYCWGAEFEGAGPMHSQGLTGAGGITVPASYVASTPRSSSVVHGSGITGAGSWSQQGLQYRGWAFSEIINIPANPGYFWSWARYGTSVPYGAPGYQVFDPYGPTQKFRVWLAGNILRIYWHNGSSCSLKATSSYNLQDNVWEDIAIRMLWDGSTYSCDVYVGGSLYVSATQTSSTDYGNLTGAGMYQQGGLYWYNDDMRIFNDPTADAQSAKAPGYVFGGQVSADSIDGSFTPSTGTDLFPCVETGASIDWAKSISTTVDGDVCRLAMDNIGGAISGTPDGVVVHAVCDTDAGMDDITLGMAESSVATPVYGTATDCQAIRVVSVPILTSDGSTAWTQASFDAANVVVKATS